MAASVQDMLMFSDDDDNTVRVFQVCLVIGARLGGRGLYVYGEGGTRRVPRNQAWR